METKSARMAECHPDRPYLARGFCAACYQRDWKERNPERYKKRREERAKNGPKCANHPDRAVLARGLCDTCYRRVRRAEPEYAEREREYARDWTNERYRSDPEYRRARKLYRYGISPSEYDQLMSDQRGLCASCGEPPDEPLNTPVRLDVSTPEESHIFHVDHCHATGAVRGLLCRNCNAALGHAKDSEERLLALVAYLRRVRGLELDREDT